MAQSFTLSSPQKFPTGTVVGAYVEPAPNWIDENPAGAPPGGQVATATVAANGTATFANLADNQRFVAYANVAGVDQYETFETSTLSAPSTAGVVTPANAAYTVADQTALANAVLSNANAISTVQQILRNRGLTS